jgi:hypothetical protein
VAAAEFGIKPLLPVLEGGVDIEKQTDLPFVRYWLLFDLEDLDSLHGEWFWQRHGKNQEA